MIRQYFNKLKVIEKDKITWRSHEVTRIEAFSDAVFAFAVSLLIISLEVPKTSKELLGSIKGFIPFAVCFNLLFWIWRAQNKFFRRYGLNDNLTLALNGALMFIVLGYVYPLKFMFNAALIPGSFVVDKDDYAPLVILFCGGHASILFLLAMMHYNAWLKKDAIALTPEETFETVSAYWSFLIPAIIAFITMIIAWTLRYQGVRAMYCFSAYALIGIVMPRYDRRRKKLFQKMFGKATAKHSPAH